jgi:Icc-related predicted phosphoesterase
MMLPAISEDGDNDPSVSEPESDSESESDDDDQIMSKFWDNGDDYDDNDSDSYSFDDKDDIADNANEVEEMKRSLYPDYGWDQIKESQIFAELPIKIITTSTSTSTSTSTTSTNSTTTNNNKDYTRIVCISDTHGNHRDIPYLPKGDILIHGGDFTKSGEIGTIQDLGKYFNEHQQKQKQQKQNNDTFDDDDGDDDEDGSYSYDYDGCDQIICIAGNHDMTLDEEYYDMNWYRFHKKNKFNTSIAQEAIRKHCIYLEDELYAYESVSNNNNNTINKINIWGSPYTPEFYNWAFNKDRGYDMQQIWNLIPSSSSSTTTTTASTAAAAATTTDYDEIDDTDDQEQHQIIDVLITHGPPLGRGDFVPSDDDNEGGTTTCRAGCYDLLKAIQHKIKPRINIFGHIHEGYGCSYDGTTLYVNASTMNTDYEACNLPIVIDLPHHRADATTSSASASAAQIVQPKSIFHNNNIYKIEELIEWCTTNNHTFIGIALQDAVNVVNTNNNNDDDDDDGINRNHLQKELLNLLLRKEEEEVEPIQIPIPVEKVYETLCDILNFNSTSGKGRKAMKRDPRRRLAMMVSHLYSKSF